MNTSKGMPALFRIPFAYKRQWIMKRILVLLMAVAALSCMAQKKTVNTDVYYARRVTLFEQLPVYSSDIIMLGNSLTDGAEWNELFDNCHVKNRGIVGDIIPGFFERLEPILKGQPRKIFIMERHDTSCDRYPVALPTHKGVCGEYVAV